GVPGRSTGRLRPDAGAGDPDAARGGRPGGPTRAGGRMATDWPPRARARTADRAAPARPDRGRRRRVDVRPGVASRGRPSDRGWRADRGGLALAGQQRRLDRVDAAARARGERAAAARSAPALAWLRRPLGRPPRRRLVG